MKNIFDQLPERWKTDCIKWRHFDEDVLPMWVADMDFISPDPVLQALRERVEHGVFGYPESVMPDSCSGLEMRQALIDYLAGQYNWHVEPEDLVFLPGVVVGFNQACHMVAAPDRGVLVQTPVYPPFLEAPGLAGLERQEMELVPGADGRYTINRDSFEAAVTDRTGLFILCNPHNPVGRVFSREELEFMAEVCLRKGVTICSDEIHCDLVYSGQRHIPIASLDPEIARSTITLMAPSKTFNLAGLQFSFAVIQNPELRRRYQQAGKGLVHWVNVMGLTAALAAYRDGWDWLAELRVYLEANRDYLLDFIRTEMPSIRVARPEGTYLAWLDCRDCGIEGSPQKFFLEKGRVALNDGATFGRGGEGFVRLNFGCPRQMLDEALVRMKRALESQ